MKLTTGILLLGMSAGAWAQNPNIIQSTHDTMKALQSRDQAASDEALGDTAKAGAQPASTPAGSNGASGQQGTSPIVTAPRSRKSSRAGSHSSKAGVVVAKQLEQDKTAVDAGTSPASSDPAKAFSFTGQRDPFVSPVVNQTVGGSGCSVGKKCLTIDQIALKGIV